MRSPLERWAGSLAVTNADLGARLALQVCKDTLREWGHETAADCLEDCGEIAVAKAFAQLAWDEPEPEDRTFTAYRWSWPEDEQDSEPNGTGNPAKANGQE